MTKGETFLLYALLAAVLSPFWGFALVAMAENAVSDTPEYPHSGFCPDCPEWEEPAEL